jgi:hypothetical protein
MEDTRSCVDQRGLNRNRRNGMTITNDKYDLHSILGNVQGWDSTIETDLQIFNDTISSRVLVTLGETVAKGSPLYQSTVDYKWYNAQADAVKQPARGIAIESGVLNGVIRMQRLGEMTYTTTTTTSTTTSSSSSSSTTSTA